MVGQTGGGMGARYWQHEKLIQELVWILICLLQSGPSVFLSPHSQFKSKVNYKCVIAKKNKM
jgi:hypothetical protein